jgi:hypothetical protein
VSVNKNKPHLIVIPEDKADQDIVNGFSIYLKTGERQLQVTKPAGGWVKGRNKLLELSNNRLQTNLFSHAVLIIDFDNYNDRGSEIMSQVPEGVRDRVFVIGVLSNPEDLKRSLNKNFEQIGSQIAEGCKDSSIDFWQHDLLVHNIEEIRRLSGAFRDIFFNGTNNN